MTVLATAAEFSAEIDVARAQRAKEQAERIIAGLNYEDRDYKIAHQALQKALVRLQLASQQARR
jgi:F-type H+-transporting ATPase subunit epsilon